MGGRVAEVFVGLNDEAEAGIRVPSEAGQVAFIAGFGQIGAGVIKVGPGCGSAARRARCSSSITVTIRSSVPRRSARLGGGLPLSHIPRP